MRSIIGLVVLLVLLAGMFGIVLPQNSNTQTGNRVQNQVNNAARSSARPSGKRNTKNDANRPCNPNSNTTAGCNPNANWHTYYGFPPPGNDTQSWVDGNTNRPLVNGTWNANTNQWDIDANALYSANAAANSAVNANRPAPKKPKRKRARPAMAFSMSIENSLLVGMQARVGGE